jgi:nifR3 family TIM-barrel protein
LFGTSSIIALPIDHKYPLANGESFFCPFSMRNTPSTYPPLTIGPVRLPSALILAPLAGYTDLPFRLLCKENGAGLCCSEMISCHGLLYAQKNTYTLLATVPEERPFAVQLFGSDPELMGKAAAIVSTLPVDLIDINMGCPVRKVIKKGCGVALMKDPERAEAIIRAVCARTHLPVTVKFRSGWTSETINAPQFARMAESAGAAALTIHGRTWVQGFGGKADRQVIAAVKAAVSIPVIGNGDVLSYDDGLALMAETNCDGVMVGRGALGNPWMFSPSGKPVTLSARMPVIERYLQLAEHFLPLDKVLFKVKNHTAKFLTGISGASSLRHALYACEDISEVRTLLCRQAVHGTVEPSLPT